MLRAKNVKPTKNIQNLLKGLQKPFSDLKTNKSFQGFFSFEIFFFFKFWFLNTFFSKK